MSLRHLLGVLVWTLSSVVVVVVHATKHSFHVKNAQSPIGPVGVPFGFLRGGVYQLEVSDFELTVRSKGVDSSLLEVAEAGFFLQRFNNEAEFNQQMDVLKSNATVCAFEELRDYSYMDDIFGGGVGDDDAYADFDDFIEQYGGPGFEQNSAEDGILLSMNMNQNDIKYVFKDGEDGLYFLIYQVCLPAEQAKKYPHAIRSTFSLDFHFVNYDSFNTPSYLTAGEMRLPFVFFFFAISYLLCFVFWIVNNREIERGFPGLFDNAGQGQPIVYPIHHLMSALLLFKFLATLFESLRYHAIRVSGHAELWSVAYYIFTFIKGTFLFTVILLIGTGWSFVKPFLSRREKNVVFVVLLLQVLNNISMIVLSQVTEGERRYDEWTAIFHVVDILCCCAVLIPIIWQVNAMEKTVNPPLEQVVPTDDDQPDEEEEDERGGRRQEMEALTAPSSSCEEIDDEERMRQELEAGDKGQILKKLKLFRSFYLLVVAYIYATRILVYLFATMLNYKSLWIRYFVVELVTLTFYVVVGFMFRPMAENPYLSIKTKQRVVTPMNGNKKKGRPNGVEMTMRKGD